MSKRYHMLFSVVLPVLAACGGDEAGSTASRPAPLVEAVEARSGALPLEESVPAVVRARNQVAIRPEVSGRVVEVLARNGDTVAAGGALVRLEAAEWRERLRQAEADVRLEEASVVAQRARVAEVEARVARVRALAEEALVSAQELESLEAQLATARASADEASARVEQARAAADEMRSALGKTVVRAPVAGRLGERRVEVGMRVDPSTELFVVGDLDELIVETVLTEAALARVEEGQPVLIETRQGPPIEAAVSRISPFLREESFTTVAEIDVDNREGRLRPGMFVTARILVGQSRRATLVPVGAVSEDPASGARGVYAVEESAGLEEGGEQEPEEERAVLFRPVEVLAQGRGRAGVTGIEEGTWVVTVGQHLLAAESDAGPTARVRPVTWERVLGLQSLQNEDLLEGFLEKQRILAAALGAEIPESEDVVNRILEEHEASSSSGAPTEEPGAAEPGGGGRAR